MANPTQQGKQFFSKVRIARELLREQAEEIFQQYMDNIKKMQDAGEYEAAGKAMQWLIEHMPSEDDGVRAIDTHIDKQQQAQLGPAGPNVQIGIVVGGIKVPGQIESTAINNKLLPKPKDAEIIEDE